MSEDLNPFSDESEKPVQPLAEVEPAPLSTRELPPLAAPSQEYIQPQAAESIMPEQPQYPPSPEFYAQMPVADPYGSPATGYGYGTPAPAAFVPPVQGAPVFPPPPAYGYGFPAPGYGYAPFPQDRPLPLGQAIRELPRQYKKILFKPGARSFAEEQIKADWGIIWMQILFLVAVDIILNIPGFFMNQAATSGLSTTNSSSVTSSFVFELMLGSVSSVVFVPLVIFAVVGIQYLMAKMFKGTGNFKQQMYTYLLFYVPIQAVSSLLSLFVSSVVMRMELTLFSSLGALGSTTTPTISALGVSGPLLAGLLAVSLVSLALSVYSIVLNVFSLMASQRLSGGRAAGSVLIPIGAAIVLFAACYCALAVIIISAANSAIH